MLDANLLVLIVARTCDARYIVRHKRLNGFDVVDFKLLLFQTGRFKSLISTPNVLTETSNLLRFGAADMQQPLMRTFALLIDRMIKVHVPSTSVRSAELHAHGLSDAVLMEVCRTGATLMTLDGPLYHRAAGLHLDCENFNHIRQTAGLL